MPLANYRGHWLDDAYTRVTGRGDFFADGFGSAAAIDEVVALQLNPPDVGNPKIEVEPAAVPRTSLLPWTRHQRRGLVASWLRFDSPASAHLPEASRRCHAMWIRRGHDREGHSPVVGGHTSVVVVLPATGDEGVERRSLVLGGLLDAGVDLVLPIAPFYGIRRPVEQSGSALRTVRDQIAMGYASIQEARVLLEWLHAQYAKIALTGYSLGGYNTAKVAPRIDFPLAAIPCAAGSSGGGPYTKGAIRRVVCWAALVDPGTDGRTTIGRTTIAAVASDPSAIEPGALEAARLRLAATLDRVAVVRHPPTTQPEHAILVAPQNDAYVPAHLVEGLHAHWAGAELRWIRGGHITGYVLRSDAVRRAILDGLGRLPSP